MRLTICTLVYFFWHVGGVEKQSSWKVVPPVYLEQVPDILVYENLIPNIFEIPIPNEIVQKSSGVECNSTIKFACILDKAILSIADEIGEEIKDFQAIRKPRQAGIILAGVAGIIIGQWINRFSHNIFGNDNDIRSSINQAHARITETQESLIRFEKNFNNFSLLLGEEFKKNDEKHSSWFKFFKRSEIVNEEVLKIYNLLAATILANHISTSIELCKHNFLPHKIISHEKLRLHLEDVEKSLGEHNFTFAIPLTDIRKYYNFPLTECLITGESFFVILNIPIVKLPKETWKIYKMIPLKFAHFNETCQIKFSTHDYLAATKNHAIIKPFAQNEHCDIERTGMCLISPYTKDAAREEKCAFGILNRVPTTELYKYCDFQCENDIELSFRAISSQNIVFTHVQKMNIICQNKNETFDFSDVSLGSIEVRLNCDCYILADDVVIPPVYPCFEIDDVQSENKTVQRNVPNLWTLLGEGGNETRNFVYSNYSMIFKNNWKDSFQGIQTKIDNFTIPAAPLQSNTYLGIWNLAISILILGFIISNLWMFRRLNSFSRKIRGLAQSNGTDLRDL